MKWGKSLTVAALAAAIVGGSAAAAEAVPPAPVPPVEPAEPGAPGTAATAKPAAAPAALPIVSMKVQAREGGLLGHVTIANPGPRAINGWALMVITTSDVRKVDHVWATAPKGTVVGRQDNGVVHFTGSGKSATVPVGGTVKFSFRAFTNGKVTKPFRACLLNNQPCDGQRR